MKNIIITLFLLLLFIRCAQTSEDKAREAEYNRLIICVVKKVETDKKGHVRLTYYKSTEDGAMYFNRTFLGNEGDTIRVKRGRMILN